jgi:hypothetical protein
LNLAATGLASNAYMLTGDKKYKNWVLEYVGAWKQRTDANGGNIPTNIGLNGQVGGEYGGKWYKGTYGWNFTIYDGEIEKMANGSFVSPAIPKQKQKSHPVRSSCNWHLISPPRAQFIQ